MKQEYNAVTKEISDIYYKGFTEKEIRQFESMLMRVLHNVEEVL